MQRITDKLCLRESHSHWTDPAVFHRLHIYSFCTWQQIQAEVNSAKNKNCIWKPYMHSVVSTTILN